MSTRARGYVFALLIISVLGGGVFAAWRRAGAAEKPDIVVAQVGAKRFYLADLNLAAAPFKYRLEQQGYDFDSESGRYQYQQLQSSVLNDMIVRHLLDLGAEEKRVTVSGAELNAAFRKELARRNLTEAALVKELSSYGWTKEHYLADLKRQLIEEKFIDRYLAKGKTGEARAAAVDRWLYDRAGKVAIQVYFQVSSGGGNTLKEAENAALDYYRKNGGKDGVTAKATNYGCHIQVDIMDGGRVVKSYGYGAGRIYEL